MSRDDEELQSLPHRDIGVYTSLFEVPLEYNERESDNLAWQKHNILTLS